MRQLCARARVRARIVAGYAVRVPCGCRGHAMRGALWQVLRGMAGHSAGARVAWHGGGILGAWRGILARGMAWRMIQGAGAETAQTVDF